MKRIVFDIEADGFNPTQIFCIATIDFDTGVRKSYDPSNLRDGVRELESADELIGHYIRHYDIPNLEKLLGFKYSGRVTDTLILSRLLNPERTNPPGYVGNSPHSIEAWGVRLGRPKVVHDDWTQFSPEMMHRCEVDTELNYEVYKLMLREVESNYSPKFQGAMRMEQEVDRIIRQQSLNGWKLDVELCQKHIDTLNKMIADADAELLPNIGDSCVQYGTIAEPFLKNGGLQQRTVKWMGELSPLVVGPFSRVKFEGINLDSVEQLKTYLTSIGWVPLEWNYDKKKRRKMGPKITEDSLAPLGRVGELISNRMTYTHRRNQLQGFLKNVREDGRIEARANTVGTNTFRMKHSVVVNVPKAKKHVFFGHEMRSVFTVEEGYVLVGADAAKLEACMMAARMNDPVMTEAITVGDFHTTVLNQINLYCHTRDHAKNIEYALIYGASDTKLGKMADFIPKGMSVEQAGANIRAAIMAGIPSLGQLIESVKAAARRGFLIGLDGRHIPVRSPHSAFNALLQCDGAVVMKVALCYLDKWIRQERLDAKFVGNFHDEFQLEVLAAHVDRVRELAEKSIVKAGEYFSLSCPLSAESKPGMRWSETH